MPRRPEHDLVPGGAMAARAVGGAIRRSAVGLRLDDPARGGPLVRVVNEDLPEQRARDPERRLEVERAGERARSHADLSFFTSSVSSGTALNRSATSP